MARMSIDDSTLRDPRIVRLSRALVREFGADVAAWPDFARRYAIGCLLDVWAISYDRKSHVVPVDDVDATALIDGFHATMIAAGLASHEHDGVAIRGARKRIAYLTEAENAGREGGKKSGNIRRANATRNTTDEGVTNLPDTLPDVHVVTVPDKRRGQRVVGFQDVVDEFDRMYRDANDGTKPSWRGGRNTKLIRDLVAEHGRDEVIRRIRVLFVSPPSWLRPPHDVGTLARHFDKLVPVDAIARNGKHGRHELAIAAPFDPRPPWEVD